MNKFIILFFLIPFLSWGLTFSDGKQLGAYKGYGWPTIEKHDLDASKEWSQNVDNEFSRFGGSSHRFELRAFDCNGFDCGRGKI